ncbi:MAG: ABC transporter substrate-binding protein [Anaerolineae bacterium]|nr:ABC transporter substrate-binding protein [Anaerolineae bacterium]MDW8173224.1 ABC transporter substrate-binding protein [Anaerolineae bacterium]
MNRLHWQSLALALSILVFGLAVFARLATSPSPQPTPPPQAAQEAQPATEQAYVTPTPLLPSPEPVPVLPSQDTHQVQEDSVVTYTEALIGSLSRLNPLYADLNPVDRDISSLIFDGLFQINAYGEAVPDLAESWIMGSEGLEYVVTLREDVLWQDGLPFTAEDVFFTVSLMQDSSLGSTAEMSQFWRTVEAQVVTPQIIRFRLTQPLASFLHRLTFGVLPEHALRGTSAAEMASHRFNITPIGTGAYQLESLQSSDGETIDIVNLRVAPNYRLRTDGAEGYAIERLRFRLYPSYEAAYAAFQRGQVDGLAARNWDERLPLLELPNTNTYTSLAPALGVLLYNWSEPEGVRFFQELRVRLALMIGLNRQTPVETHLNNRVVVADSPILANSWAYDPTLQYPVTNPLAALDLLRTANIQTPKSPQPAEGEPTLTPDPIIYRFSLLVEDNPPLVAIAREIAAQWSQYGLEVTVEAVPAPVLTQRLEDGDFMAAIAQLTLASDPDGYAYWHVGQAPDGKNYGALADDRLSELLERARRDANGINRVQLYQQFQRRFIDRAVAIPLYTPLFTYVVSNKVNNVQLGIITDPTDRFRTLRDWIISS